MRIAPLLALACLATGCFSFEVARLARVRATRSQAAPASKSATPGVGRSCVTVVVVVPVTPMPDIGNAVADAAHGAPGLRHAIVRYELRYVPFVGGRSCYVVRGEPE